MRCGTQLNLTTTFYHSSHISLLTTFFSTSEKGKETRITCECKGFSSAMIAQIDGDPIRTSFTHPVSKVGAIFGEGVAVEGHSAIVREEVGIKEHLSITIQGRLDVQHTVRGNEGRKVAAMSS